MLKMLNEDYKELSHCCSSELTKALYYSEVNRLFPGKVVSFIRHAYVTVYKFFTFKLTHIKTIN